MHEIPIFEKVALTIEEAAEFSNIGRNTLRMLAKTPEFSNVVLRVGNKILIKRRPFEDYLHQAQRIPSSM